MVDDLVERVQRSQNRLEELMAKIPGIGAYQRKEQRRDADKLLRLHIAGQLDAQLRRLGDVQYALTSQGRLDVVLILERAATKLQLLIDRIKTASYGYAGLFDAIKVDEAVLDRLYLFDEKMLEAVDELATSITGLAEAAEGEAENLKDVANGLVRQMESLNTTFSQRQDVILA